LGPPKIKRRPAPTLVVQPRPEWRSGTIGLPYGNAFLAFPDADSGSGATKKCVFCVHFDAALPPDPLIGVLTDVEVPIDVDPD
jgi:hypothetical protein